MKKTLIEYIASYSGIGADELQSSANSAPHTYKRYSVPKKKGGRRTIFHPAKQTKTLQYLLMRCALSRLRVHEAAAAYVSGVASPLLKNARKHSERPYLLKVDFTDFFPSIKPLDLLNVLQQEINDVPFRLDIRDEMFLINALFVQYDRAHIGLAIGAPSSPMISNAVMYQLDVIFSKLAKDNNSVYTRYADDMIFSCTEKGTGQMIYEKIKNVLKECKSPSLILNERKTRFLSKKTRRPITGLIVSCDGSVSIGRKNKRRVKGILWRSKEDRATDDELKYIRGYLAFIRDVDPRFLDSLILKHGMPFLGQFISVK